MLIGIGLVLAAALAAQDGQATAAVDPEAEALATMRLRAAHMCETRARPAGEAIGACTERRVAAVLATYGSPTRAVSSMERTPGEPRPPGSLGFANISARVSLDAGPEAETPRPTPQPERRPLCRRETVQTDDQDGPTRSTSTSTSLVCGNGDSGAAQQMLDSLREPPR
ncbi:MAG TPA: hypothetical protein VGB49_08920 [Caulobacteraceae bacterium]|jgi:hypothetical protein